MIVDQHISILRWADYGSIIGKMPEHRPLPFRSYIYYLISIHWVVPKTPSHSVKDLLYSVAITWIWDKIWPLTSTSLLTPLTTSGPEMKMAHEFLPREHESFLHPRKLSVNTIFELIIPPLSELKSDRYFQLIYAPAIWGLRFSPNIRLTYNNRVLPSTIIGFLTSNVQPLGSLESLPPISYVFSVIFYSLFEWVYAPKRVIKNIGSFVSVRNLRLPRSHGP